MVRNTVHARRCALTRVRRWVWSLRPSALSPAAADQSKACSQPQVSRINETGLHPRQEQTAWNHSITVLYSNTKTDIYHAIYRRCLDTFSAVLTATTVVIMYLGFCTDEPLPCRFHPCRVRVQPLNTRPHTKSTLLYRTKIYSTGTHYTQHMHTLHSIVRSQVFATRIDRK